MTQRLLIYHHLGLGDHIICHGIIREYYNDYDVINLCCKSHNAHSVRTMYADLPRLFIINGGDDFATRIVQETQDIYDKILKIGFNLSYNESFEKQFYKMAGVKFDKKWDNFKIPYCYGLNNFYIQKTYEKAGLVKPYAFIHDDNRFKINNDKINNKIYHFRTTDIASASIIYYIDIIKNANEIHVIDSAFLFLIDCLDYDYSHQQLFVHRYARDNPN